jgi:histidinol-phosphatase
MNPVNESSELLTAVGEVARVAGNVALDHFMAASPVELKADGSPITVADRAAEAAAREWIERRFPHDGIVGEELGVTRQSARRRWFIDPIDGTRTFVRGVPLWGTLVAVLEEEVPIAGAAIFPALGEEVVAARGEGCWWNGRRAQVSGVQRLADALVLTTDEQFRHARDCAGAWSRLAAAAGMSRTWGDCYGYLLVATGRAEAMVDAVVSPWDTAALAPLIEEAGGVFTDLTGATTALGSSAVATNARLASGVRTYLQSRGTP